MSWSHGHACSLSAYPGTAEEAAVGRCAQGMRQSSLCLPPLRVARNLKGPTHAHSQDSLHCAWAGALQATTEALSRLTQKPIHPIPIILGAFPSILSPSQQPLPCTIPLQTDGSL